MADLRLMKGELAEYLAEVARRRFAYGANDCATLMADWLVRLGLPDPMADLRGSYETHAGWRRVSRREGGMLASCRRRFVLIEETRAPVAGDVALIASPILRCGSSSRVIVGATGAICVDANVRAFLTERGVRIRMMPTIAAWRVNYA